jgi:hypothetical protein
MSTQPNAEAQRLADDIRGYERMPYTNVYAYELGCLVAEAREVVGQPSERNLRRLADMLAGIELASEQRQAEIERRLAELGAGEPR